GRRPAPGVPGKKVADLAGLRAVVAFFRERGVSERRACRVAGIQRSTWQYKPQPDRNADLRERLRKFAEKRRRWGFRKAWNVMRRQDRKSTRLNSSHTWISYAVF